MAVRVHVPPVAVRKVCAMGHVADPRNRAAGGSAGAEAARARSPPRSGDSDSERHVRRRSLSGDHADPSTQTSSPWVATTGPTYHASSSPNGIERGDHGNNALYLRDYPFGNAQLVLADGGWAVTALLEMAAASGIGLSLGFALRATFSAATISWSQERMLRKAARARANADWQRDSHERLPL